MDRKNLFKKNGQNIFRVDRIFNIQMSTRYLHRDYELLISDSNDMTETGFISIFTLKPKNIQFPSFIGRWDQNKSVIDIDIAGVERKIRDFFKSEKGGYSGHHPKMASISPRLFAIDVKMPEGDIFRGGLTFNINYGHDPDLFRPLLG